MSSKRRSRPFATMVDNPAKVLKNDATQYLSTHHSYVKYVYCIMLIEIKIKNLMSTISDATCRTRDQKNTVPQ